MTATDGALMLYLVRHGLAQGTTGRCVGHCDLPLSPDGREAVLRLATQWGASPPRRIVASDLARARTSANLLAETWNVGQAPATDPRLREMHFGNWDGLSWDDVEQRDAHALAAWMADWQHQRAPGGESFTDLIARVADWLADLAAATRRDRVGEVVVVAHAGSIRALLVHAVGLPRDLAFRVRLDVARVSGLLVRGDIARTSCNLAEVAFLNADRVPPSN